MLSRLSIQSNLRTHPFSNARKTIAIVFALLVASVSAKAAPTTGQIPFSFPNLGSTSIISGGTSGVLAVGDAAIQMNPGSASPSGVAIFALRETGVLGFAEQK